MKHNISVVMVTYNRGWALPFSLNTLVNQSHIPDEVVVVLKPSVNSGEKIINRFSRNLNINLVIQGKGNITDAYCLGIERANNDYIAFLDDDAIAEKQWIQKYLDLFERIPNAGGIGGIVYKALISNGRIVKVDKEFYDREVTVKGPHRRPPLSILKYYDEFISTSGFPTRYNFSTHMVKSVTISGDNMAFRRDAIIKSGLSKVYKGSRIGNLFESYLALCARLRGYDIYRIVDPNIGPVVWHICHSHSLQRTPLRSDFWRSHDLAHNYWRLKFLGLETSFPRYLAGLIVTLRRNLNVRLPAYIYGAIRGALFYLHERRGKRLMAFSFQIM